MKCDKISDLNQAIDDLDDTQFRGSIKAGSRGSNGTSNINDLSQELPLNTNNHEGISQKMYSSMSQNVDVRMLQEDNNNDDSNNNNGDGIHMHKEFSFNH